MNLLLEGPLVLLYPLGFAYSERCAGRWRTVVREHGREQVHAFGDTREASRDALAQQLGELLRGRITFSQQVLARHGALVPDPPEARQ